MDGDSMKYLAMAIEGIEQLSEMLEHREALRRLYGFCQDAYTVTGNKVWLRWQALIGSGGKSLNWELGEQVKRMELMNLNWVERAAGTPYGDEKND